MHEDPHFSKHYRDAMAHYAGHVQIVTTAHGGVFRGVTATAACSVSDAPPTVLACVNRMNEHNAIFEESGNFALNTLAAHHRPLADAFAGFTGLSSEERFAMAEWEVEASGAPVLADALASFDCRLVEAKAMTTHWILIGEVASVKMSAPGEALLYYRRGYHYLS
ncbi:MAG: flavin reductase [Martelella sp.]|uniref:flavin reductase n=1 Tax=Martelella sp. TaxID=1969699 RepID=UPI0032420C31